MFDMTKFFEYRQELRLMLSLRHAGDVTGEHEVLDRLNDLWEQMDEQEHLAANVFAAYLNDACLDRDGNVVRVPTSPGLEPTNRAEQSAVAKINMPSRQLLSPSGSTRILRMGA